MIIKLNERVKCDIPVSCDALSTTEACKPGINSSQDAVSVSESVSSKKKTKLFTVYVTYLKYYMHMCRNFTVRLFVVSFEFLCSEVGEVVVIKWVPCRLCRGVGGTARGRNSWSSFALVLHCITNTKLNRLDEG